MTELQATIKFADLVEYVIQADENEVFGLLKTYIRDNFDLCDDAVADLVDTDTHDNFVWFFAEYLQDYQIEFEMVKGN